MKRLSSVIVLALLSSVVSAQATVDVTILNPPQPYVVMERVISPVSKRDTVQLDAKGHFTYTTDVLEEVTVFKLVYSNKKVSGDAVQGSQLTLRTADLADKVDMLLDDTYNLKISFDANDRQGTIRITGKGSELVDYYNTKLFVTGEYNKNYGKMVRSPKDTFLNYIDNYYNAATEVQKRLLSIKYLSKSYIKDEAINIKYLIAQRKCYYAVTQISKYKNDSIISQFDDKYFAFLKEIPFDRPEFKDDRIYTAFVRVYVDYLMTRENKGAKLSDADKFTQKYEIYKTLFKSDELRDFQMFDMLYANNSKAREDWYAQAVVDYNGRAANDSLKHEINNILVIRQKMGKGMPAYDFTVYDRNGKSHTLSEFKGKYVYIDTWATWCKPCVYEIPYLQKLEEDWKGRNLVFISVSVDNDSTRWRKYLEKRDMHGNQFWNGNDKSQGFYKEFLIQGIPRFILIDPEGKFIDPNAPRPSYPDLSALLRSIKELRGTPAANPNSESLQN